MKEDYDWRAGRTAIASRLKVGTGVSPSNKNKLFGELAERLLHQSWKLAGVSPWGFESLALRKVFYSYILRSQKDGTYYYGSAENINQRLIQHNNGKVRSTKGHRPYRLHYSEELSTRAEAVRREKFYKSIAGYRWLRNERIIRWKGVLPQETESFLRNPFGRIPRSPRE